MEPPNSVLRGYGLVSLAGTLILIFVILHSAQYDDGIRCIAMIKSSHSGIVYSPGKTIIVKDIYVNKGCYINKGQCLITYNSGLTVDSLYSPAQGSLKTSRPLKPGENIPPGTALFFVGDSVPDYLIKIHLSKKDEQKIAVGQKIAIDLDKYPKNEFGYLEAKITSAPYRDLVTEEWIADATVIGIKATVHSRKLPVLSDESGKCLIVTRRSNLLNRYLNIDP